MAVDLKIHSFLLNYTWTLCQTVSCEVYCRDRCKRGFDTTRGHTSGSLKHCCSYREESINYGYECKWVPCEPLNPRSSLRLWDPTAKTDISSHLQQLVVFETRLIMKRAVVNSHICPEPQQSVCNEQTWKLSGPVRSAVWLQAEEAGCNLGERV